MVAGTALIASAAFSIGEVRGARHHTTNGSSSAVSSSPLSGLSISGLQNLESQVSQAAAIAQGATRAGATSSDLSQLEQQLGISPSASTPAQAQQLETELDAINACLSGSTATSSAC
jgi:hypothetical protein